MKQCLEILGRGAAADAFTGATNSRSRTRRLAREFLSQIDCRKLANPRERHDCAGIGRGLILRVGDERRSTHAVRAEQHFISLEVRWFHQHARTVGQLPLSHTNCGDHLGADNFSWWRHAIKQWFIAQRFGVRRQRGLARFVHNGQHFRFGRNGYARFAWNGDQHDAVVIRNAPLRRRVHLGHRDTGQQSLREIVFDFNARDIFLLQKISHQLVNQCGRVDLFTFGVTAFVRAQGVVFGALQFRVQESKLINASCFHQHGFGTFQNAAIFHTGVECERLHIAREERTIADAGAQEWCIWLLGNFAQACAQYVEVQAFDECGAKAANCGDGCVGTFVSQQNAGRCGFSVGCNRNQRHRVVRHTRIHARPRSLGCRNATKVLLDEGFNVRDIKITNGDYGHQVWAIPIGVKLSQSRRLCTHDAGFGANRKARCVFRSFEQNGNELLLHAFTGAQRCTTFFVDNPALGDNFG